MPTCLFAAAWGRREEGPSKSWEQREHALAAGIFFMGTPAGLTVPSRSEAGTCWPGGAVRVSGEEISCCDAERGNANWRGREKEFLFSGHLLLQWGVWGGSFHVHSLPCLTPPPTHMRSPCSWLFPPKRLFPTAPLALRSPYLEGRRPGLFQAGTSMARGLGKRRISKEEDPMMWTG